MSSGFNLEDSFNETAFVLSCCSVKIVTILKFELQGNDKYYETKFNEKEWIFTLPIKIRCYSVKV